MEIYIKANGTMDKKKGMENYILNKIIHIIKDSSKMVNNMEMGY